MVRIFRTVGARTVLLSVMSLLVGVLMGVGVFTFGYANGFAYFGNEPETCAQCHAMKDHYNAWLKSSHRAVAGCNDCHTPHDNVVMKYVNKGENGFWHSLKFTTQDYPDNIKIREHNREITEQACLSCHADMVGMLHQSTPAGQTISCIRCHSTVGHLE